MACADLNIESESSDLEEVEGEARSPSTEVCHDLEFDKLLTKLIKCLMP
jgi:hypothetical protein